MTAKPTRANTLLAAHRAGLERAIPILKAAPFCTNCRTDPCRCVACCHGCDARLPDGHFCSSCGEVMEAYLWPMPREAAEIDAAVERMIAIQSEAYPAHWTPAERREMAERDLLAGRRLVA